MIIIRKFFSNNPYEETKRQQKDRRRVGKAITASGALLGAGLLAKRDIDNIKSRANNIYEFAGSADIERLGNLRRKADQLDAQGHRETARRILKNLDKTRKHLFDSTERFKKRTDKLIPKVATKGAVIGGLTGGTLGAGLYYGLVRSNIKKGNEDLNRSLKETRDSIAERDQKLGSKNKVN